MLQLIWTTQTRKCFILCHQALDPGCIWVLWRELPHLSPMSFGMEYLLEQTQVNLSYQCRLWFTMSFAVYVFPLIDSIFNDPPVNPRESC
ncbi:hypothetical protein OIU84_001282 [Salix udensis]|uniref:Uncharacterized protein n=1 Tax=Salix udensis TaxID=889485 RepID=A0AAD6P6L1_9ROSI|nr:hypothetical protein OIU84_001282 [Salix udensis]